MANGNKATAQKAKTFIQVVLFLLALSLAFNGLMQQAFIGSAEAAFPDDWTYYKVCNIGDTTSDNYQMKLNVSYDGTLDGGENVTCNSNCNTDFSDLRFYEDGNSTELAAWNETQSDGNYIVVWINVSQAAMTDGKIIMWYGNNNAAPYWDGDTTFVAFDDFSGSDLSEEWTDCSDSTEAEDDYTVSDSKFKLWGTSTNRCSKMKSGGNGTTPPLIWESYSRYASSNRYPRQGVSDNCDNDDEATIICKSQWGEDIFLRASNDGTSGAGNAWNSADETNWHTWGVHVTSSECEMWRDYTHYSSYDYGSNTPSGDTVYFHFTGGKDSTEWVESDWIRIRKYASTEPSWSSFSSEQTQEGYVNTAPSFSGWQPTTTTLLQPTANVTINDQDGNSTTVDWYISTDNSTWGSPSRHVATHTANTSDSYTVTEAASKDTTYYIKVTAYDGHDNSTQIWSFNTISLQTSSDSFGWQGEIQSSETWNTITTWSGSIANTSRWESIKQWAGAIQNTSEWQQIQSWSGTVQNQSGWQTISSWQGSVSNTSQWTTISSWSGTITNSSSWQTTTTWSGSLQNQSSWQAIATFSGTVFNASMWAAVDTWNGNVANTSKWRKIAEWAGQLTNTSQWTTISTWQNNEIMNTSQWNTVTSWTGEVSDTSSWQTISSWEGATANTSQWNTVSTWTGSVSNTSSWNTISTRRGTVDNTSRWTAISSWNGDIKNTSQWNTIASWNGEVTNTSQWTTITSWTGVIDNTSSWQTISSWNGDVKNTSQDWLTITTWNGELDNTSSWHTIMSWAGEVSNTSQWNTIASWNGEITNSSSWYTIDTWTGTVTNTSQWHTISSWNGEVTNASSWQAISSWIGEVKNTSSPWITISTWNGAITNQSSWHTAHTWTGSLTNTSQWNALTTFTGTLQNYSTWRTAANWDGTITNTTTYTTIDTWTGTIDNTSSWHTEATWTGDVTNTSSWRQITTWTTCNIINTTNWTTIETWNGTVYNGTGTQIYNETPPNGSTNIDPYTQLSVTVSMENETTFNLTFYIQPNGSTAWQKITQKTNITPGTYSVNTTKKANWSWYNWTYNWTAHLNTTDGNTNISSGIYTYDTSTYTLAGCPGMQLLLFLAWLGLFALIFLAGLYANSSILGLFAASLIIILGAFIILQGVYIQVGETTTQTNPNQQVTETEFQQIVAPTSSYSMVWGVIMMLFGIYIMYANAESFRATHMA